MPPSTPEISQLSTTHFSFISNLDNNGQNLVKSRRRRFNEAERRHIDKVRKAGACSHCRLKKIKCIHALSTARNEPTTSSMTKDHKSSYVAVRSTSQLNLYNFAPANYMIDNHPQQNQGASGKDIANDGDRMKTDQQPGYSQGFELHSDYGKQEIGGITEVLGSDIFNMKYQPHLLPQRVPYLSSEPKISYNSLANSTSIETLPNRDLDRFIASFDSSSVPSSQSSHDDDQTFFTTSTNPETSEGQSFWAPDIKFWNPNNFLATPVQYSYDTFPSQTPDVFRPDTQEQADLESSTRYNTKDKTKQELSNKMSFGEAEGNNTN